MTIGREGRGPRSVHPLMFPQATHERASMGAPPDDRSKFPTSPSSGSSLIVHPLFSSSLRLLLPHSIHYPFTLVWTIVKLRPALVSRPFYSGVDHCGTSPLRPSRRRRPWSRIIQARYRPEAWPAHTIRFLRLTGSTRGVSPSESACAGLGPIVCVRPSPSALRRLELTY